MARIRLARWLYGLALLAMPLSYATRDLLGVVGITWVDPTLILGLAVFLLMGTPMKEKAPLWLVGFAFVSAFIGMFLMHASPDREKDALYVYYVEPIRLALNIIWFWVSISFLKLDRKFVLRWLAIGVAWEFSIACYMYLAFFDLVPVPQAVKLYLDIYKTRQVVFWGDVPIYRMAGTFTESPSFGLFMFCCFVIFALALSSSTGKDDRRFGIWLRAGAICAFLGTVASLSDQTLIALLTLGLIFALVRTGRNSAVRTLLWFSLVLVLALYSADALATRWKSDSYYSGDPMGTSISERSFHARYGLGLFIEQPASMITGIGPGRYGDYAVRTGYFPSTVTTQFTIIEWVVEYGFLGLCLIGRWLFRIGSHAVFGYGIIGAGALTALLIANMFQANWKWEAWFLALAFLYASVRAPALEAAR
jgi:hypothetical protein